MVSIEKNAQPKTENYVLFSVLAEYLGSVSQPLSDSSEGRSKEVRNEPGYIGMLGKKKIEQQKIIVKDILS